MAGIGEASAILAVAQLGFAFSTTLIAYVGEVKDAHSRINRIGNEIQTTSEQLKEIGQLVERNKQNPILNQATITSAVRCSSDCRDIIDYVKKILCKSEWQQNSEAPEKGEIDISLFSRWMWPLLARKLEIPRVELQRIKIDLLLIFSAAMAFAASTTVEQESYKRSLPKLKQTKSWAAKRSEKAKRRAQRRSLDAGGRRRYMYESDESDESDEEEDEEDEEDVEEDEDEDEKEDEKEEVVVVVGGKDDEEDDGGGGHGSDDNDIITPQSIIDDSTDRKTEKSEEDSMIPQERQRGHDKSPMIEVMVEDKAAKGAEDGSTDPNRREDAHKAVEKSRQEQENFRAWTAEREILRNEMTRFGVREEQIQNILETPNLNLNLLFQQHLGERAPPNPPGEAEKDVGVSKRKIISWCTLQGWWSRKNVVQKPSERSVNLWLSEHNLFTDGTLVYETWMMDLDTSRKVVYSPSQEWLTRKLSNPKRDRDLQDCVAKMNHLRKVAVLSFIKQHVALIGLFSWRLYHIELSQRPLRTQLPGQKEPLVVLIFCARSKHRAQEGMHMQQDTIQGMPYMHRMSEYRDRHRRFEVPPSPSGHEGHGDHDARIIHIDHRGRSRSHNYSTIERSKRRRKRSKRVPETKPSDAEIIDQILREYTTFGDDGNAPSATVSSAPPLTTANDAMPGPTSSPVEQEASMNGGPANAADGISDAL